MGEQKKPWETGKSFDRSAPIGPIHRVAQTGHFRERAISLKVNGVVKQSADLRQMIWSVAEQISQLLQAFELMPGDIIFSGTPENVGPVVVGDVMQGAIASLPTLDVKVVQSRFRRGSTDRLHHGVERLAMSTRRRNRVRFR